MAETPREAIDSLLPAPAADRPRIEIATIGHIMHGNAPAPQGRTFTEAKVREILVSACDESARAGYRKGFNSGEIYGGSIERDGIYADVVEERGGTVDVSEIVTSAIQKAIDSKEDTKS